jgi:FkbM family methyltransferase
VKKIDLSFLAGKDISLGINYADELFNKDLEGKINAHKIYNKLLDLVANSYEEPKPYILRGLLRHKIWKCENFFCWNENYFSQSGQDKIIKNHFFRDYKNGFFIEIGAFDGLEGSNCFHFEKFLDWKGIAIEASPTQFDKLKKNRKCKLINKAISTVVEEVEFIDIVEGFTQMSGINNIKYNSNFNRTKKNKKTKFNKEILKTSTFDEIVSENFTIDYLSIDIEGSEFELIKTVNFEKYDIKVISVENSFPKEQGFKEFFMNKNFSYFDRIGADEIFYNNKYYKL